MSARVKIRPNEKYNYWIVESYAKNKKKYLCKCICGSMSYVSSSSLKTGKSKSCGCMQKSFSVKSRIIESGYLSIRKKIYDNYSRSARKRGYTFELDLEQFTSLILGACHYCGSEPNMLYKYGRGSAALDYGDFKYNGVDRVDNTIGYNNDNVVPCCKICNNSKATMTIEEWILWLQKICSSQFYKNQKHTFDEVRANAKI